MSAVARSNIPKNSDLNSLSLCLRRRVHLLPPRERTPMGRRGGGVLPPRRPSTLSSTVVHRQIDACKINHMSSDNIADHLYSNYAEYKRYKLIPFRNKIKQILQHSPHLHHNASSFDDEDDSPELRSPRRKKQKPATSPSSTLSGSDASASTSELEFDLMKTMIRAGYEGPRLNSEPKSKEDDSPELRSPRRKKQKPATTSSSTPSGSDASASTSELEFDLTKTMLRSGYEGSINTNLPKKSKSKEEEENLEVEDVRKEKEIADFLRGDGGKNSREVVEGLRGLGVKGKEGPRFRDLGGITEVLEQLKMEVIVPLYHPQLHQWLGVRPMAGILLHGPPGCGKTRLAHAIANETGVPFYQISATEVVSGVSGASEENIRELFSKAYRTAPSIVFIDEIDAIASKRETLQREMERRIVTQLLTCMDESHRPDDKSSGYVLVIGATNRPDAVDPALRRPGRFDREIALGVPDERSRVEILSVLTQNLRLADDLDLMKIARATPGFVGADLAALANKAGNLAMKRIIDQRRSELSKEDGEHDEEWWKEPWSPGEMERLGITMADFEEAAKMVQPSSRREGFSAIPNVKWDDVGGLNMIREEFERYVVRRVKNPEDYEKFGVDLETGFLLYGPPGCGKTLIAKAVANEAGANFIHIKGPELLNKYVGESELHVRTIFSRARTCAPCILFFDEVDALTTKRGKEGGWVVERLLNQLLIELDGAEQRRGVYVIGATNRPEVMDRAVLRPGRFGKLLYVPLPTPDERGLILKALARTKPIDATVDLLALGKSATCQNLSGADLSALMNEAAMAALEEKLTSNLSPSGSDFTPFTIKSAHFEQALRKVTPSVSEKQKMFYEQLSMSLRAA